MKPKIHKILPDKPEFPEKLKHIAQPPKQLFVISKAWEELLEMPAVAIVGSRKASPYGREVTESLARDLAKYGVLIVSGLALGADSIAHKAATEAGGKTLAVLPCGLDRVYPASHYHLAKDILASGGALLSEYAEGTEPRKENFIARNRLVNGLSLGVIITEAAEKSGTLITAGYALDEGRTVMSVPGNITSYLSVGANNLIKAGAIPVTDAKDVMQALDLVVPEPANQKLLLANNKQEHTILKLIQSGVADGGELLNSSGLDTVLFNQTMTSLELGGQIRCLGADQWTLA